MVQKLRESSGEERGAFIRHDSIEKRIGVRAAKVLRILVEHSDSKGVTRLPRPDIARKAGMGEENTKAALRILYKSRLVFLVDKEKDCVVRKLNFVSVGNLTQVDIPTLDALRDMKEHGGRRRNSGRKYSKEK